MEVYCRYCGKENNDEQKFCKYCGKSLLSKINENVVSKKIEKTHESEEDKETKSGQVQQADKESQTDATKSSDFRQTLIPEINKQEIIEDSHEIKQPGNGLSETSLIDNKDSVGKRIGVNKILVITIVVLASMLCISGVFLFFSIRGGSLNPFASTEEPVNADETEIEETDKGEKTEENKDSVVDQITDDEELYKNDSVMSEQAKSGMADVSEEEMRYIDEAEEFLKKDMPLEAAEVLTSAMTEDYYPFVYDRLKQIRRNSVDNSEHIIQYNENSENKIYEAWLEIEYKDEMPSEFNEYTIMEGKKSLVESKKYSDEIKKNAMPMKAKIEYDTDGRISMVVDEDSERTYDYDDYGRIKQQKYVHSNAFGRWITVYEYTYSKDGWSVKGRDISEDGGDLGYDNTSETRYDALGGVIYSKEHWEEEGEVYGGHADRTHEYHYIPELNRMAPENTSEEEIWNYWPGNGLYEIMYGEISGNDDDDYIISNSSTMLINKNDLRGFTEEECRIARNEIYARHGRKFKDEELQNYFNNKSWYVGITEPDNFDEKQLSKIELDNIDTITEYEKEMGYR